MELPRVPLILAPTPLHPLPRLSARLGVDLWIKRDDLTGLAMGGNKGRKLEYLVSDALESSADTIVTCGSVQSNFIRQLGAACAIFGLRCVAVVMRLPVLSESIRPGVSGLGGENGNVLLDRLAGVDLRVVPDGTWDDLYDQTADVAQELRDQARRVYEIPVGGSSPLGAFAFYRAGLELMAQSSAVGPFDWIVFASSSGSTHTGLAYAFRGTRTAVLGIACDPEPDLLEDYQVLYAGLEALTGEPRPISREDWKLSLDYVGPGYGVPSPEGDGANLVMTRSEGILLDPIYTGKAFSGLLDLVAKRDIAGRVLFWHTGGTPALFATE